MLVPSVRLFVRPSVTLYSYTLFASSISLHFLIIGPPNFSTTLLTLMPSHPTPPSPHFGWPWPWFRLNFSPATPCLTQLHLVCFVDISAFPNPRSTKLQHYPTHIDAFPPHTTLPHFGWPWPWFQLNPFPATPCLTQLHIVCFIYISAFPNPMSAKLHYYPTPIDAFPLHTTLPPFRVTLTFI